MSWSACAGDATGQPAGALPPPGRPAPSGSGALQPGEYLTERGWGRLVLKSEGGVMAFSLETVTGDNLCTLDGTIDRGQGIARQDGGRSSCMVGFGVNAQGVDVKAATPAECRDFCGYNGSFAGRYLRVKQGCGRDEVDRTRAAFQRLYDQRNFKAALATLSPYMSQLVPTSVVKAGRPALATERVDSPPRSLCLLRARARMTAQGARWWSLCSAASRMVDRTHFVFVRLGVGEPL